VMLHTILRPDTVGVIKVFAFKHCVAEAGAVHSVWHLPCIYQIVCCSQLAVAYQFAQWCCRCDQVESLLRKYKNVLGKLVIQYKPVPQSSKLNAPLVSCQMASLLCYARPSSSSCTTRNEETQMSDLLTGWRWQWHLYNYNHLASWKCQFPSSNYHINAESV
jgi:hypothetical protein